MEHTFKKLKIIKKPNNKHVKNLFKNYNWTTCIIDITNQKHDAWYNEFTEILLMDKSEETIETQKELNVFRIHHIAKSINIKFNISPYFELIKRFTHTNKYTSKETIFNKLKEDIQLEIQKLKLEYKEIPYNILTDIKELCNYPIEEYKEYFVELFNNAYHLVISEYEEESKYLHEVTNGKEILEIPFWCLTDSEIDIEKYRKRIHLQLNGVVYFSIMRIFNIYILDRYIENELTEELATATLEYEKQNNIKLGKSNVVLLFKSLGILKFLSSQNVSTEDITNFIIETTNLKLNSNESDKETIYRSVNNILGSNISKEETETSITKVMNYLKLFNISPTDDFLKDYNDQIEQLSKKGKV